MKILEKAEESNVDELISVIIPVYNVEEYLEDCINSICNQTYKKIEIIIVDDGSTDNSGVICDKLQKMDGRIHVFHTDNGGQGRARNIALDVAKGEYLIFVDSDDIIASNMIEELLCLIKAENADIVACDYAKFEKKPVIISQPKKEIKKFDRREAILDICKDTILKSYVWNKIFKKELFAYKRFSCNKVFEDAELLIEIVGDTEKVVYTNQRYYYYRTRMGSTVYQTNKKKFLNELDAYENQLLYAKKECRAGIKWIESKIAEIIRDLLDYGYIDLTDARIRRMKNIYRKNILFILFNTHYSIGMKIAAIIISISVPAYMKIRQR